MNQTRSVPVMKTSVLHDWHEVGTQWRQKKAAGQMPAALGEQRERAADLSPRVQCMILSLTGMAILRPGPVASCLEQSEVSLS